MLFFQANFSHSVPLWYNYQNLKCEKFKGAPGTVYLMNLKNFVGAKYASQSIAGAVSPWHLYQKKTP